MLKALAREQITVSSTAKTLTATYFASSSYIVHFARIQVLGYQVRATYEGTAPVASTTGDLLNVGDVIEVWGTEDLKNFKAIRESSDATLVVTYFGVPK